MWYIYNWLISVLINIDIAIGFACLTFLPHITAYYLAAREPDRPGAQKLLHSPGLLIFSVLCPCVFAGSVSVYCNTMLLPFYE